MNILAIESSAKAASVALCREEFLDLDAGAFAEDTSSANDASAEESDITAPYAPDTQTPVFKQPGLIPLTDSEGAGRRAPQRQVQCRLRL